MYRAKLKQLTGNPTPSLRVGVTLLELVIAVSIVSMLMLTLVSFATTVEDTAQFTQGYGEATQHARVIRQRIDRTVAAAVANEDYPGIVVLDELVGSWRFPDTLIVWSPESGVAASPSGCPLVSELVVYMPNPDAPNELWELTDRGNTSDALSSADATLWTTTQSLAGWQNTVAAMVNSADSTKTVLTDVLRVRSTSLSDSSNVSTWRGCVRFESRLLPSWTQWTGYKAATLTWNDLSWAQSIHGSDTGLRQVWLRFEFQLRPERTVGATDSAVMPPVPFFGSAALYYEMHR